jgi:hypothetical protein
MGATVVDDAEHHWRIAQLLVARPWHGKCSAKQLQMKALDDGTQCYVALTLDIDDLPILQPHATIAYTARFDSWHSLQAYKLKARALIDGQREQGVWWQFSLPASGRSFWVDQTCEAHALLLLLQQLLPHGQPDDFEFHVSWGRPDAP